MSERLRPHLPWLAGFLLSVNIYLVPPLANSPRALDLAGLVLAAWMIHSLARGALPIRPLVLGGLTALAPLTWLFFGYLGGDGATINQTIRWLLAVPCALALLPVLEHEDRRRRLAWGLLVGGGVNVAVILLQTAGLDAYLRMVGLSASDAAFHHWVGHIRRIPGLHGHHNSSSAVISLMVPAVLYLYFRGQCRMITLLGVLAGLSIALHLTSTRSPIVVTVLTVVYAAAAARRVGRVVLVGFVLITVVAPLVVVYGPPGGWSRWRNVEALGSNVSERVDTNLASLVLIASHPQGLGVAEGKEQLADATAIAATHNAFLQAALFFGAPLGLLVMLGLGVAILRGFGGPESPFYLSGLLAFQTAGLFMFEEHLNNPTFVVIGCWCIVALGWAPRSGAEDPPPVG